MRFMGFDLSRLKEKTGKKKAERKDATNNRTLDLEEQLNGRTNALKQTAQQLKKLSNKMSNSEENEDVSYKPHGPIGVLEVEAEDGLTNDNIITKSDASESPEKEGEDIKLVEVRAKEVKPPKKEEAATTPQAEAATLTVEEKKLLTEENGDSLNKLFSIDEEEENPLANLIHSLPDVTAEELIEDLNEIKAIIIDWQKK